LNGTTVGLSVEDPEDSPRSSLARAARLPFQFTPVIAVISAAALLALALRGYELARPGHLLGVGDYDDGTDFGSAILFVHGVLPYRDFVTLHPPGLTLLMTPAALLSRALGTAWAIAAGRMLTALASTCAVILGGLIVRHRGLFAVTATCGFIAIYPGSVQAAHTVLLEPWLVLFCMAGAALAFDGDVLASNGRLTWSGVAFGFAGAIKVWAIIPAGVILVILLAKRRPVARYLATVAAGFLIPVLPFAAMAPVRFFHDVVLAQLFRTGDRTSMWYRLQEMTGLTAWHPTPFVVALAVVIMMASVGGALIGASLVTGQRPPALEWFALAVAGLVGVAFLVPDDFYYHYPAFFGPFLAMAFALPAARYIDNATHAEEEPKNDLGSRPRRRWPLAPERLRRAAVGVTALAIVALPMAAPQAENSQQPTFSAAIAAVTKVIPRGACIVTDQASLLISADRFVSSVRGCMPVVDGFGISYALGGRSTKTAGSIPAVAEVWKRAFDAAQYVLLTRWNSRRIAWTPELRTYLRRNFVTVKGPWPGLTLYVRSHPR
jgi:alpha-1,2-mannosyltransferase